MQTQKKKEAVKYSILTTTVAIAAIAGIELYALNLGYNGISLIVATNVIALLAGVKLKDILQLKK